MSESSVADRLNQAAATKDGDKGPKRQCPVEATLDFRYEDLWWTSIHKFGFSPQGAANSGFLTGKPQYLVGGRGQTGAAKAAGVESTVYDARIYSHFNAGAIEVMVGTPSESSPDKEGHRRAPKEKRRFLTRALELEVYLYVDSLWHWTLATFDAAWPPQQESDHTRSWSATIQETSTDEAITDTEHRRSNGNPQEDLQTWLWSKRQHWSNVLTKRSSSETPAATHAGLIGAVVKSESRLKPHRASGCWNGREELHQIFEALASGRIDAIEARLRDLLTILPKSPAFLEPKLPAQDDPNPNTFWAEGLCETVRETTLASTVFPQLMAALICNIPAGVWKIASPETSDLPLRIMAQAAVSLVYKLNAAMHLDTTDKSVESLLASLALPTKTSVPEYLQDIHELMDRLENINTLIALHGAALHDCFTHDKTATIRPGDHVVFRPRAVNGARPATPTQVLCFRAPGASKQNKRSCDPTKCSQCRKNACAVLPCTNNQCREDSINQREFMRQLREQEATLNGTPKDSLTLNRELVGSHLPKQSQPSKISASQTPVATRGTALVREEEAQKAARDTWLEGRTDELLAAYRKNPSKEPWSEKEARDKAKNQAVQEISENLAQRLSSRIKELKKAKPGLSEDDLVKALLNDKDFLAFARRIANKEELTEDEIKDLRKSKDSPYKGLAALHALDIFAGGNAFQILGLGDARVNSSIGGQWTANAKRKALNEGLLADNEYPNFELVVCPSKCGLKNPSTSSKPTTP